MMKKGIIIGFVLSLVLSLSFHLFAAERKPILHVQPNKIHINAFFKGQKIKIFGYVPKNWDVAIKICGSREEVTLKRKGKVGILWMNVGTVKVKNAPNFYLIATSTDIDKLASPDVLKKAEIGYDALKDKIKFESTVPGDKPDFLFKQFVMLKKKEKLYSIHPKTVVFEGVNNGLKSFSTTINVPAKIPLGKYTVDLYGFNNGQLVGHLESFFHVDLVGFPAFCRNLAFKHSLLYGILAVILAIVVGFFMGFLFGSKGGH